MLSMLDHRDRMSVPVTSNGAPPHRHGRGAMLPSCVMGLLGLLTACGVPQLQSHAEPADTLLHRDGRQIAQGSYLETLPYYGTIELAGFSPPDATLAAAPRFAVMWQDVPPPISGWLFPLDFLIEAAASVWREPPPAELTIRLPPVPKFEDVVPPGIEDLRRRSARMRAAR